MGALTEALKTYPPRDVYEALTAPYGGINQFEIVRASIKQILQQPLGREWSLQGFGQLRLYLSKELRLHVWSSKYAKPGIDASSVHDHPWDFTGLIVNGLLENQRYLPTAGRGFIPGAEHYWEQTIKCGPGGCAMSEKKEIWLVPSNPEVYTVGQQYSQRAEEIHRSVPDTGCVSIIQRRFKEDTEHARVFWQGNAWVSAEPRKATDEEILAITKFTLQHWSE